MSVLIGYIHTDTVSHSFLDSLWRTQTVYGKEVERFAVRSGPMTIPAARNTLVEQFLASRHEHLWMVDTDMGWADDALDLLVAATEGTDGETEAVVGAYTVGEFGGSPDGLGGMDRLHRPVMYREQEGFGLRLMEGDEYTAGGLVRVDATGAACLMIPRSAVEGWSGWFDTTRSMGEDIAFCMRLKRLGRPLFVHTGVKTSHHKGVWLK